MGQWKYEAFDRDGKREVGTVDASERSEVRKFLRTRGLRPKKIEPPSILEFDIGEWMVENGFAQAFGAKQLLMFTKQLTIMIEAGVPIIEALEILYKQEKNLALKKSVKQVSSSVKEGKTISEAMEKEKGFDKLYCNLIKAGEAGGVLDVILKKLTTHLEKSEKIKSQVKSAMTYPFIVSLVGGGVIWAMLVFVVPQFVAMLNDTGKEIPAVTQFVIDVSDALGKYSVYGVPALILLVFMIKSWTKTPTGKIVYDKVFMRLPLFGGIVIKGNLSSFTRTLGTMLSSGVSLVDALDICIETIDNGVISEDLKTVKKKVVEGKSLTEPLEKIEYFPPLVVQMVRVGEQTGQIDNMLEKVADVFEDEVNELVGNMTKLIEPLIIVVLGGIVALILVAMYLPMFSAAG
jgi:type IV pilus assembly protein PilC